MVQVAFSAQTSWMMWVLCHDIVSLPLRHLSAELRAFLLVNTDCTPLFLTVKNCRPTSGAVRTVHVICWLWWKADCTELGAACLLIIIAILNCEE